MAEPETQDAADVTFKALMAQSQALMHQQAGAAKDVLTPGAGQAGVPLGAAERTIAALKASKELAKPKFDQYAKVAAEARTVDTLSKMFPEAASKLGTKVGDASSFALQTLKDAGKVAINALDVVGSQLDRPGQFVNKTALALARGDQWQDALKKGLIGSVEYGWHNPHYTSFTETLDALGVGKGTVYKKAGVLPEFNTRNIMGTVLDVATNPINLVAGGASKSAIKLAKIGEYLNPKGARILLEMEKAGALSENKLVRSFLESRGQSSLLHKLDEVAPIAKQIIENPTPEFIAANRSKLHAAYQALHKEISRAADEGKLSVPHPNRPGETLPVPIFDQVLRASYEDKLADLVKNNPRLAKDIIDKGGIKFAGQTLPGTPQLLDLPKQILSGAGNVTTSAGKMIQKLPGGQSIGGFIERQPQNLAKIRDAIHSALNVHAGLSPEFSRFLDTHYFAPFKASEYELKRTLEKLFSGVSYADKVAITKAIDSRQIEQLLTERPRLQHIVDGIYNAHKEVWDAQVARGLVDPADYADNYIFHFYHNRSQLKTLALRRADRLRDPASLDPSSYQRLFDTLAEAEAAGLQPEYDASKLVAMRLMNGWRSVITHDFLEGTSQRFGNILDRGRILQAADEAGKSVTAAPKLWEMIQDGSVGDISSPARVSEIAERLALEGDTPLEVLRTLPEPLQRSFLERRFGKAILGGGEKELANVRNKYKDFQKLWPKGQAGDLVGDTLGLPRPPSIDGPYRTVAVPNVGRVVLPDRIASKLLELQKSSVFNEAGGPIRDMLVAYQRFVLNPFRKTSTGINPSFHFRNFYTNLIQSGMDIGLTVIDPQTRAISEKILRGIKGVKVISKTGEVMSGQQLMAEFVRYGGMQSFYKRAEVTTAAALGLAQEVAADTKASRLINPFYWGKQFGQTIENDARMVHFLALRRDGMGAPQAIERLNHFLFDYSSMTPTERYGFRVAIPFWCVPDDTEILTNQGWKTCDTLKISDTVLTYNIDMDYLEWQQCTDKQIFEHDQDLMFMENAKRKILFTPNHKWIVEDIPCVTSHDYGVYHYGWRNRRPVGGQDLTTSQAIVMAATINGTSKSTLTPDQARLLGWLLTDGYWRWRGNCVEAVIYQHPKKFLEEVTKIAGGKPRAPHPDTGCVCVPVLQELIEPLKPYLKRSKVEDNWIDLLSTLSRDALFAMYEGMYMADGTVSEKRKGDFFASRLAGVKETFIVLATLLGHKVWATGRGVYLGKKRHWNVAGAKLGTEHYRGRVWCPVTPNGTWVMRQNNTVMISHNTWTKKNIALQSEQLVKQPRVYLAYDHIFKGLQDEHDPEKAFVQNHLLPAYMKSEWALDVGQGQAPQMRKWLMGLDLPLSELNKFKKGTLAETFRYQWINQLGPLPELGGALYDMVNDQDAVANGMDSGKRAYYIFNHIDKVPGLAPLKEWLQIRNRFDSQGRVILSANPARAKMLGIMTFMDRPLRELSAFVSPEDSWTSALSRYLTGIRFVESNPEQEKRYRSEQAAERVLQYLRGRKDEFITAAEKESLEPGSSFRLGK